MPDQTARDQARFIVEGTERQSRSTVGVDERFAIRSCLGEAR